MNKIDFSWNKKLDLDGDKKEVLDKLKKLANPNCNKCFGRGYTGYIGGKVTVKVTKNKKKSKDKKVVNNSKNYIICPHPKCVSKNL